MSTREDLSHLAFYGHSAHVRTLFETMTPTERTEHAEPEILRQAVLGGLARLRVLPADASLELRREREFLESVVELFVAESRRRRVYPRDLFRTLLDWSDELLQASRLTDANDTCNLALTLGVSAFPEIWPWIQLRKARALTLLGNVEAAHATLLGTYLRLRVFHDETQGLSKYNTRPAGSAFTAVRAR